jgi:methylamine utilization protein MauJ
MAYLMDIALDNSRRLNRKSYLFEYKGIRFKLVQDNPRKWSDHLLTIVSHDDQALQSAVFETAAEFASCLNWGNGPCVGIHAAGLRSWPSGASLAIAKPSDRTFPRIANKGLVYGYNLVQIPLVRTQAQRLALALFREANSSNNDYLSFLFYWQILEVDGGDPVGFVNKTIVRHSSRLGFSRDELARLPLAGRKLGNYLLDDCRHAIAHIRRWLGKKTIDVDQWEDRVRIELSTRVLREFARFYISDVLDLSEKLYLVRKTPRSFSVFADPHAENVGFKIAYPHKKLGMTPQSPGPGRLA